MSARPLAQALHRVDIREGPRADDPDPVRDVLDLVEGMRRKEDGPSVINGLVQEGADLALDERVQASRGLVEDDEVRTAHERLDETELLAISLGELTNRTIENDAEPVAKTIPQRLVDRAPKSRERIELLATSQPIRETEVTWQIPHTATGHDTLPPGVVAEDLCAPSARSDETEEQPDRRALACAIRAEEAEDFTRLDPKVEIEEGPHVLSIRL